MNAIPQRDTLRLPSMPVNDGPVYDARLLVGPESTARIVLDGKVYTLRITKAGKLILTK